MLEQRLYEYVHDTENPEKNYNLGLEYKKINQTASALSFFLRCAERTDDLNLAYECLIHIGNCFDAQGKRLEHAYNSYQHAISILPKRPEAYYHLCRLKNWNSSYNDGYTYSSLALDVCDFDNLEPLSSSISYGGKHYLLFEKALSSWYWGKVEDCKNMFLSLREEYWYEMNQYQQNIIQEYLKQHYDIDVSSIRLKVKQNYSNDLNNEKSIINLSSIFETKSYDTDKNDLGYLDNFYNDFFARLKNTPITMMEIGVCRGGSINLWKDYLHPQTKIYAADINYFEHVEGTCSIIGDMYDDLQVLKFSNEYFDLIIDDGPHSYQSFVDVIQKYHSKIKKGGVLIVEDIIKSEWVQPLCDLCYTVGYSQCTPIDMTGKQKTDELLDQWKNGLFILRIEK